MDKGRFAGLAAGTVIGRDYCIVAPLREASASAVYEATNVPSGGHCAIKLLALDVVADARGRERFAAAVQVAKRVASEHVVNVLESGIDSKTGVPWIAMELLFGEDLGSIVDRRGALDAGQVLTMFEQLCHAVGAAHRGGMPHGRLRPQNVFISTPTRPGIPFTVKVLDFGIGQLTAEAAGNDCLRAVWQAPEQTLAGSRISMPADVWAIGLIGFYALTGKHFWLGANAPDESSAAASVAIEILSAAIPKASARAAELGCGERIPHWFDSWFGRCVVRYLADRFPDATTAFDELDTQYHSERISRAAARIRDDS